MPEHGWIKVCGITSLADANMVADAGADAIGLNLWPESPRYISLDLAKEISDAMRDKVDIVLVTVDKPLEELAGLLENLRPDWLQLHGNEPDEWLTALGSRAYKAVGLLTADDTERALQVPGRWVLVDARDDVRRGGTGESPPATLAAEVCAARPTILAGGLGSDNVGAAIAVFRPAGVDAASRLERGSGVKNPEQVREFVRRARQAFEGGVPEVAASRSSTRDSSFVELPSPIATDDDLDER